ncbi:DUF4368 domain-containing protein [Intestinimonas timonensis]|uniref:DUF4368 domain-containing protein n=1 Tax=Intestinimonas timonensis TaxID=1689270 RepID=UPI001F5EC9FC|nr:DUF4368 domain-containing protein [Intestinimonas timonensis]
MQKKPSQRTLHQGKQTLHQLKQHGASLTNIEITEQNIKAFSAVAKKYDIDYALKKDPHTEPPHYCGDILNFKTYSKSYKNKKRLANNRENWVIFQDVHEPIIERSVFEQVRQKRGKIRKRRTHEGERNMFSGLLVCADCGHNLHFHFNQGNPDIKYFNCSNYKGNRGTCTSTHYTRARKLTPRMLNELIEKIEVFNAEKVDGVWEQRLRIHYNCVGAIEIPDLIPLPAPEVSVNARKGVVVNYAPSTIAG